MLRRLALLVLAALAVAACGDDADPVGLSVNGVEYTIAELDEEIADLVDAGVLPVGQNPESAADTQGVAGYLNALVVDAVVREELAALEVEVSDEDRAEVQAQADQDPTFGDLPDDVQDLILGINARQTALAGNLSTSSTIEQACGSHILVETEDEAVEIIFDIGEGAEFATLAQERSLDPGSGAQGGELGCAPRGQFVPEFEEALFTADPGELVGPVETEFGFHVIVLDEIIEAPDPAALDTFLQGALVAADVEVAGKYGTWNAEAGVIDPPEGAVNPQPEAPVPGELPVVPEG